MKNLLNMIYLFKDDLITYMEAEKLDLDSLSRLINISRPTLYQVLKDKIISNEILEKFYSYVYNHSFRFNKIKEELLKETNKIILFHGSKEGIRKLTINGSRDNCDFGRGFYLGESFNNALNFICDNMNSSIYSFSLDLKELNILKFGIDLDWMLAICYYRGLLNEYINKIEMKKLIDKIEKADVIIAPIADNRMFYIMSLFASGDINVEVALHSLSASDMGLQYVIKTDRALDRLKPIEKYYLCKEEKADCHKYLSKRGKDIETKLKIFKRIYKDALYIEELFK